MTIQRNLIIISRVLASLIMTLSVVWLVMWYVAFRKDIEILASVMIILMSLHIFGALGGIRANIGGLVIMVLFTTLSIIAPFYLNIPFYPPRWMCLFYLILIFAELILLVVFVKKKNGVTSED